MINQMIRSAFWIFGVLMVAGVTTFAQPSGERQRVLDSLDKDGCITLGKTRVCKYDYAHGADNVEAISVRPIPDGKYPAVLLIPGYQRRAIDQVYLGTILADEGFASLAITQPGFGKSTGKPDYVGPSTIEALALGLKKFQRESFVDKNKIGLFGYSRGGMAASLLAVQLKDVRAVVLGAGIYDLKMAYDEIKIEGIRENMKAESGMTPQAIQERSSILKMKNLNAPVLILHGEKDLNVPVSQALALRDALKKLNKPFEIKLFPEAEHSIPRNELVPLVVDFLKRHLK